MATIKKGILTSAKEWWVHLRDTKREFWKGERKEAKKIIKSDLNDGYSHDDNPFYGSR